MKPAPPVTRINMKPFVMKLIVSLLMVRLLIRWRCVELQWWRARPCTRRRARLPAQAHPNRAAAAGGFRARRDGLDRSRPRRAQADRRRAGAVAAGDLDRAGC